MTIQAQLVMILWFPIVYLLFKSFPVYKAIIISFITSWLFLPVNATFVLTGLPDYERISATCYSIVVCIFLFRSQSHKNFRFRWIDISVLIYCLVPFFSSLSNGLGAYNGLSLVLSHTIEYGLPYFLGRIYLSGAKQLYWVAKSILVSGMIYIPLCWIEIALSPILHRLVYGYTGTKLGQNIRYGGFRPTVFMRHGLSVGMWMMAATLIAFWLWQSGLLKKIWNIPIHIVSFILLVTLIGVKSTGAWAYIIYALFLLFCVKYLRFSLPLLILCVSIITYLFLTSTGQMDQALIDNITSFLSRIFDPSRIESLQFRLDNEHILSEKALERPLLGWGGYGRNRVFEENSLGIFEDITVTDSLWIIIILILILILVIIILLITLWQLLFR